MSIKLELFTCHCNDTVVEAMKKIDKNSYGLVYVLDENEKLVGSVTDGDIRRWIIKGGRLKTSVSKVMNSSPIFVDEEMRSSGSRIMLEKQIPSVAVLNKDGCIIDILFSTKKVEKEFFNSMTGIPVVIMAGGKGTRLYPYTKILPKPLVPIGEVPILERILERFVEYGVMDFYLTINYRKEMIKSYFAEMDHDYNIHYVEEDEPLGTAGSLGLICDKFDKPVIVSNCDILIEADYSDILKHHMSVENDLTIVSSLKTIVIPYGVIQSGENGIVCEIQEKPEISKFVNTGMYIINPEYLELIPKGKHFHMTELANLMMKKGKRVGMYPISENAFLDMGEFSEMKRMEERINSNI